MDFPQTDTELSLPQTSLIYTDATYGRKYLIFIDFQMELYIYDISSYFDLQGTSVPLVSQTNLFSADYINVND